MKTSIIRTIWQEVFGKKEKRTRQEKEIVALAQRKGGRVSLLEIVAETSMGTEEADAILAEMMRNGHIGMDVTDHGEIVYVFPGIAQGVPESASAPSPAGSNETTCVQINHVTFELLGCQRSGTHIVCEFVVRTDQSYQKLGISSVTNVFDEAGNRYRATVRVSSVRPPDTLHDTSTLEYIWVSLAEESAARIWVNFRLSSSRINTLALLELHCKDDLSGPVFTVQFHQIPLTE